MEIGHNVMHGQWDWMNDPEIHSGTWEWDNVCPAEMWKHSHNFVHHTFTNVIGRDNDVGYGILRVAPEQRWTPATLGQPVYNALLALLFEWGVALHDLEVTSVRGGSGTAAVRGARLRLLGRKVRHQVVKDYIVFPLLSGPSFLTTLTANATANMVRNLWSNMIIFCGHFPDGAEKFTEEELDGETRPSGSCASCWARRTSRAAGRSTSCRAAWATRSSTTSTRTCRPTGTRRSPSGSATCATATGWPTPPGRWPCSTPRRCAPSCG